MKKLFCKSKVDPQLQKPQVLNPSGELNPLEINLKKVESSKLSGVIKKEFGAPIKIINKKTPD